MVASLLGASTRLLSGPNTAVSVMIGAALLPLAAPGSSDYLALAAALTVLVGVMQLLAAACGAGRLLGLLPPFVCNGLTAGIGIVMISSQLAPAAGMLPVADSSPWLAVWSAGLNAGAANPCAIAVALATVAAGCLAERLKRRAVPPLVAAMFAGTLVAWLIDLLVGPAVANIDRVGQLQVLLLPWSVPTIHWDAWYELKQLVHSAAAISVVGGLQTVMIARTLCGAGSDCNPRRELMAQGVANLSASLTGGFAGSGSFNRTAAHVKAGAETPWAAVLCSLLLLLQAWLAGPVFAHVAAPAVAGTIALIGWGMLRSGVATLRRDRGLPRIAALLTVVSAVATGVEPALALASVLGILSLALAKQRRTPA